MDHVTWADWSADGADLAVVRLLQDKQRIEFPIGNVIYETDHGIAHLRVSPGGDWLAFGDHPNSEGGSLEVVGRTGEKRVLSSNWADLGGVAWRPDGREIWFTAARRGEVKSLRAVTLDGAERLAGPPAWSSSLCRTLAAMAGYCITLENYSIEMRALGPSSSTERDLTWLGLSELADLSSDGRRGAHSHCTPREPAKAGRPTSDRRTAPPGVRLGDGLALALSPVRQVGLI